MRNLICLSFYQALFVALALAWLSSTSVARADNQQRVVDRLVQHGELSPAQARTLVKAVSKRMKRAAAPQNRTDRVRAAVASALAEARHASKRGNQAKVRQHLRAGLDEWALEHLFTPGTSSMTLCGKQFKLTSNLCESLLAASGGISLASTQVVERGVAPSPTARDEAKVRGGGALAASSVAQDGPVRQPAAEPEPVRPPTKRELAAAARALAREQRLEAVELKRELARQKREQIKEKRLAALEQKRAAAAARVQAKRDRLEAAKRKREEIAAARAKVEQERLAAIERKRQEIAAARAKVEQARKAEIERKRAEIARKEQERLDAIERKRAEIARKEQERLDAIERKRREIEVARAKAEYDKQRAAYLDRKRQEMAERKGRNTAAAENEKVKRGPASRLEAELVGLSPDVVAEHAPAEAAPGKAGKAAPNGKLAQGDAAKLPPRHDPGDEVGDLVDDLMADPLGKEASPH